MEVQNTKDSDSEEQNNVTLLSEKIEKLEAENKKIRDEFNVQRAKMKDLFLQKEEEFSKEKCRLVSEKQKMKEELDEIRSQLLIADIKLETDLEDEKRKAHEEIASLQQLVHETVEESSSTRNRYDYDVKKLQMMIQQLQDENKELKSIGSQSSPHHTAQESSPSLAPSVMLSAVTKTLVRKLGADTFSTQDNLEESMRKAQEDAEMLRSLVVPLEEEIKALKDKLRSTDEQLQRCIQCGHNTSAPSTFQMTHSIITQESNSSQGDASQSKTFEERLATAAPTTTDGVTSPQTPAPCDMCSNYEAQLVREQQRNTELGSRLSAAEKAMERHKEDLLKEIGFRKDMEEKWNEKKEEHKQHVSELNKRTLCAEQDLHELRRTFNEYSAAVTEQLQTLTKEREQVHERLIMLQKENDRLVGKYAVHSQQLQNETINLPDTVEELQEKLLKLQEDLIIAVVGKEAAQEQEQTLQAEIILLRNQLSERDKLEHDLLMNLDLAKKENELLDKEKRFSVQSQERMRQNEKTLQSQITSLNVQLGNAQQLAKQLEDSNGELRSRVASLQQELDNSEHVQKDFVLLSQSLQVQLEKIRASDTQVRWQYEDDVDECHGCRNTFTTSGSSTSSRRSKHHCLHCGQIFCISCLGHTVPSGPKQRMSRVCDVCHTLLVKSSAPYFSSEPPHSPD